MITTTKNEGGSAIQAFFPVPVPASNLTLAGTLASLVGPDRARTITAQRSYALGKGADMLRETMERIVTDGVWRCPNRDVAASWARGDGTVWVGEWVEGVTYPSNTGSYCQASGRVCHEVCRVAVESKGPLTAG
jgi:hypothetical protein